MNAEQLQEHEDKGAKMAHRLLRAGLSIDEVRTAIRALARVKAELPTEWAAAAVCTTSQHREFARDFQWKKSKLFHAWLAGCESVIEKEVS